MQPLQFLHFPKDCSKIDRKIISNVFIVLLKLVFRLLRQATARKWRQLNRQDLEVKGRRETLGTRLVELQEIHPKIVTQFLAAQELQLKPLPTVNGHLTKRFESVKNPTGLKQQLQLKFVTSCRHRLLHPRTMQYLMNLTMVLGDGPLPGKRHSQVLLYSCSESNIGVIIGTTCVVSAVNLDFNFSSKPSCRGITNIKITLQSSIRQARSNIYGSF